MLNKHCPSCKTQIKLTDLQKGTHRKAYLSRKPVECPHCKQLIQLPPLAEKCVSIGLLLSVIAAPLYYYWFNNQASNNEISSGVIFAAGLLFIAIGIIKNQPTIVSNSH